VLTPAERAEILGLARETLQEFLKTGKLSKKSLTNPKFKEKHGVFVSLHTKQGDLRGCIGLIEAIKPLGIAVQDMVLAAATDDPRFMPVTLNELRNLKIEISVLSLLSRLGGIKDINQIEVGKHGLLIQSGPHCGLLLPQVATEYGWTREEFLAHTCQKAGLPLDAWNRSNTEIYLFTAEVFGEPD